MCAVPKGFRTNINIKNQKIGPERRQEILDGITDNGTFLPRSVLVEDMDQAFVDHVGSETGFGLTLDGSKVPVKFLTIQRWSEFSKTWEFTDKDKNIKPPFITIVRRPDIQKGTNQAGLWNIPCRRTYTMTKVPTWDGVRRGIDLYKVPQPTSVDLTYEVRIFTNKLQHINIFNTIMQLAFQSRQYYININGHPMPLVLEGIVDESDIDNFESRRLYSQLFEIKLLGYVIDEKDCELVPTINRTLVAMEVEDKVVANANVIFTPTLDISDVNYTFDFKPKAEPQFSFKCQYDVNFTQLTGIQGITRIVISVNGAGVFDGTILTRPLTIRANDIVNIRVYKDFYNDGIFKLMGNTI